MKKNKTKRSEAKQIKANQKQKQNKSEAEGMGGNRGGNSPLSARDVVRATGFLLIKAWMRLVGLYDDPKPPSHIKNT